MGASFEQALACGLKKDQSVGIGTLRGSCQRHKKPDHTPECAREGVHAGIVSANFALKGDACKIFFGSSGAISFTNLVRTDMIAPTLHDDALGAVRHRSFVSRL
ncbi:hypothetical protein FIV42_06150 [Persicimonas caeni]|uniref:Uncharacterized protein n=1 Tax=Persicimonas caeni TaxID=2292766 RepID=A0A4Y6PQE5_PERCE|nr:hypothetical protein [Persicimonas caeni]QDG50329.1 hypothetical protein FIV42_06150 [Persicimonas caeni]QED31550.1 hypothetical protein FRD00_06145 [Persicimonas caeni]